MSKFKEEKKEIQVYQYPIYSTEEIRETEKELENYRVTKTITEKGVDVKISFYDETKWMQDNGVLGKYGGIIMGDSLPNQYEILRNKLTQVYKYQHKREYAQKMQRVDTGIMSNNIKVENETTLEVF